MYAKKDSVCIIVEREFVVLLSHRCFLFWTNMAFVPGPRCSTNDKGSGNGRAIFPNCSQVRASYFEFVKAAYL
jgi:hypothetical protein